MNKLLKTYLVFIFTLITISATAQQQTELLKISKFVDGDTFWVINEDGTNEKIRLIGIDTPEARRTGRTEIEYFGKEASAHVKALLIGKRVRLVYDVGRYDRYKRTLAYVYLEDGRFLNALLVQDGYATAATFPPNVKYAEYFKKLEKEARSRKAGMWAID
ncbi:thermonuclease family protein [Algoriphagus aquimarinus]|uniref:thermonuclease family protein n=1 Tax=Algoriphagus aquimarinus TaxID=237018 RepID=UPI0030DA030C|tara:strand:+ start:3093 stop:3575 length:483 start_codon:yes stop_codon:yes gene_type:complete